MDYKKTQEQLLQVLNGYLRERSFDPVEIKVVPDGDGLSVRLLVDRVQGGITMGECAGLNKELLPLLDEKLGAEGINYNLEVSSPGLDRPLRSGADFSRNRGRLLHFFLSEPVTGKVEPEGKVTAVFQDYLEVDISAETVRIPLGIINMAKQVLDRNRE